MSKPISKRRYTENLKKLIIGDDHFKANLIQPPPPIINATSEDIAATQSITKFYNIYHGVGLTNIVELQQIISRHPAFFDEFDINEIITTKRQRLEYEERQRLEYEERRRQEAAAEEERRRQEEAAAAEEEQQTNPSVFIIAELSDDPTLYQLLKTNPNFISFARDKNFTLCRQIPFPPRTQGLPPNIIEQATNPTISAQLRKFWNRQVTDMAKLITEEKVTVQNCRDYGSERQFIHHPRMRAELEFLNLLGLPICCIDLDTAAECLRDGVINYFDYMRSLPQSQYRRQKYMATQIETLTTNNFPCLVFVSIVNVCKVAEELTKRNVSNVKVFIPEPYLSHPSLNSDEFIRDNPKIVSSFSLTQDGVNQLTSEMRRSYAETAAAKMEPHRLRHC